MRIIIGIPCMGTIHAETVGSLCALIKKHPEIDLHATMISGSLIYSARNAILEDALKDGADYLLFIDSDIIFPDDALTKLLSLNTGVATGVYWRRSESVKLPVIYRSITPRSIFNHLPKGEDFTGQIEGVQEVAGCGMGFCLIRRDVMQKISKRFKSPFEPYKGLGEDLAFCYRLKRIGVPIYALNVGLKHIGIKYYDGEGGSGS